MTVPSVSTIKTNVTTTTDTPKKTKDGRSKKDNVAASDPGFEAQNGSSTWACAQQLKAITTNTDKKGPPSESESSTATTKSTGKSSSIKMSTNDLLRQRVKSQALKFYVSRYGLDSDIISNTQLHKSVENRITKWAEQGNDLKTIKSKINTYVNNHKNNAVHE